MSLQQDVKSDDIPEIRSPIKKPNLSDIPILNSFDFGEDDTTTTITGTTLTDGTATLTGGVFSGIADLGTVNTVDIDGGTIDGVTIATSDITVSSDKTLDVMGATIPGAPGVLSGFNNYIAWGETNGEDDVSDFYKIFERYPIKND